MPDNQEKPPLSEEGLIDKLMTTRPEGKSETEDEHAPSLVPAVAKFISVVICGATLLGFFIFMINILPGSNSAHTMTIDGETIAMIAASCLFSLGFGLGLWLLADIAARIERLSYGNRR